MRKYFSILSLVLITSALCAKAFIPFVEFERLGGKLQLGWIESLEFEAELEESAEQDDKLRLDGPSLAGLPMLAAHCVSHPAIQSSEECMGRRAHIHPHCLPYLLFGVLRL
jgi:hypothetical protein